MNLAKCAGVTTAGARTLVAAMGFTLQQLNLSDCPGVDCSFFFDLPILVGHRGSEVFPVLHTLNLRNLACGVGDALAACLVNPRRLGGCGARHLRKLFLGMSAPQHRNNASAPAAAPTTAATAGATGAAGGTPAAATATASGATAAALMAHEGVACDRCGMAPLRGPRFLKPATRNPSPSSGGSESGGGTSSTSSSSSSSSGGEMNLCASDFGALPDDAKVAFFEVLAPGAPPTSCLARAAAGSVADPRFGT